MACVLPSPPYRKPGLPDAQEPGLRGFLAGDPIGQGMEEPPEEKAQVPPFPELPVRSYLRPRALFN